MRQMLFEKGLRRYRRATLIAALGALVLILGGTGYAFSQTNLGFGAFFENIPATFNRWRGLQLSVKVDHPTLPANGLSQTKITVITNQTKAEVDAEITSGEGKLDRHPDDPDHQFVYTASRAPGPVKLTFTSAGMSAEVTINLTESEEPRPPTIVDPPNNSKTNNPKPDVAGTAVPGMRVVITTDGLENVIVRADDQGVFKTTLAKGLGNGQHTISATQLNELNQAGATSNLVTLTIEADPIKVSTEHIRTSPRQIIAGQSFGVFIPVSLNASRVVVELGDQSFELTNPHNSSVFSGVLPSPDAAGVYFANLVVYDAGDNPARFDNLLQFSVVSS